MIKRGVKLRDYIEERVIRMANYMVSREATIRETARKFGISRSCCHFDLRNRLPKLDMELYRKVDEVLEKNKRQRHINGGLATKRKYMELREQKRIEKRKVI